MTIAAEQKGGKAMRAIDADALKKDLLEQANMNEAEGNYDKAAEDRLIADYLRLVPTIAIVPERHGERRMQVSVFGGREVR